MKKIFTMLLSLTLLLSACSNSDTLPEINQEPEETPSEETAAEPDADEQQPVTAQEEEQTISEEDIPESQPSEAGEDETAQQSEAKTETDMTDHELTPVEDPEPMTVDEFKSFIYPGMDYNEYSAQLMEWVQSGKVVFHGSVEVENDQYPAETLDEIELENGFIAVGIAKEDIFMTIAGLWSFRTLEELKQSAK
ncbi:hypothetical protein GJU40_16380 [Bacillus lacus]|uniref:Uncharacterized protein n=1 Tax=Metabacillus lacus TaxID=1983721 RepID=A0A7X2J1R3_9BACI|nr:hypothetical protein [Metabacillus lacus]MRX73719.1 hypothetical protein [Metabacillus lacus]